MPDDFLTVADVAGRLQLNEWTIREWLKSGKIKGAKFGDTWRIKESDLQEFIDSAYKVEKRK